MKKKKSHSQIPNDPFTWSTGNNFGADAFSYERENNEGVLEPQMSHPVTFLPDEFVSQKVGDFEVSLESVIPISLEKEASVIDLKWLDPQQEQDPKRLPRGKTQGQPPLDTVSVLEDLWGSVRTTGVDLVPNKTKHVKTPDNLQRSMLPGEVVKQASQKALRRAHFGYDLDFIKKEAESFLKGDKQALSLLDPTFSFIEKEGSLIGNVYIIASVFPDLKNGKWVEHLKKKCKEARYILTEDPSLESKLNKKAVRGVPWEDAFSYYAPRLQALGSEVKKGKNLKLTLKKAFSEAPKQPKQKDEGLRSFPVEGVRLEALNKRQELVSKQALMEKQQKQELKSKLDKWVKNGFITKEQHLKFISSSASSEDILKSALSVINITKQGSYQGTLYKAPVQAIFNDLAKKEKDLYNSRVSDFSKYAKSCASKGLVAKEQVNAILEMDKDLKDKEALLKYAIENYKPTAPTVKVGQYAQNNKGFYGESLPKNHKISDFKDRTTFKSSVKRFLKANLITPEQGQELLSSKEDLVLLANKLASYTQKVRTYEGQGLSAAVPTLNKTSTTFTDYQKQLNSVAKEAGVKVAEVESLIIKAKELMHKGLVKEDLSNALQTSFGSKLYKAASGTLQALRNDMEGIVGHLYVDASFYAEGSKCDKGSKIHKGDSIPYVKEMDKCSSCIFKKAQMDGTFTCSKYGKELVSEFEGLGDYRKRVLASYKKASKPKLDTNDIISEHENFWGNTDSFWGTK